jgi:hypothetical protein
MHPLMWLVKKIHGAEIVQMYAPDEIIFWSCGTTTHNRAIEEDSGEKFVIRVE